MQDTLRAFLCNIDTRANAAYEGYRMSNGKQAAQHFALYCALSEVGDALRDALRGAGVPVGRTEVAKLPQTDQVG